MFIIIDYRYRKPGKYFLGKIVIKFSKFWINLCWVVNFFMWWSSIHRNCLIIIFWSYFWFHFDYFLVIASIVLLFVFRLFIRGLLQNLLPEFLIFLPQEPSSINNKISCYIFYYLHYDCSNIFFVTDFIELYLQFTVIHWANQ